MTTEFFIPFDIIDLEKSDDSDNPKSRKIGGYASTEKLDRQNETLIQKGLDFSEFMKYGWFNDDHDKTTAGVVGYPTKHEFHEGKGHWVEGYLVKGYKKADDIWELAKALHKSGDRRLGFSVQGGNTKREGSKITKAVISQVAITHCPVNPECKMDVLCKSLCPHCDTTSCNQFDDCCMKSLSAGYESTTTDMTGGAALRKQDLDKDLKVQNIGSSKCKNGSKTCDGSCGCNCKDKKVTKSIISGTEIIDVIKEHDYNDIQVEMIYNKFKTLGFITTKEQVQTEDHKEV